MILLKITVGITLVENSVLVTTAPWLLNTVLVWYTVENCVCVRTTVEGMQLVGPGVGFGGR